MDSLNFSIGTIEHVYGLIVCQMYELSMRMCMIVPNLVLAIERIDVSIAFAQVRDRIHREP